MQQTLESYRTKLVDTINLNRDIDDELSNNDDEIIENLLIEENFDTKYIVQNTKIKHNSKCTSCYFLRSGVGELDKWDATSNTKPYNFL